MPKEILFRMPGRACLEVGWSKGGEATARVVANEDSQYRGSETFNLTELDNAISVLQKIRKQTFETSLMEALLDSTFLTNLAKNNPSQWVTGVTQPNVPNAEAWITYRNRTDKPVETPVPGISRFVKWDSVITPMFSWGDEMQYSASFLYLREKKTTEPTTARWARLVQRAKDGRLENADTFRTLFIKDFLMLNARFDNFLELCLRQALFGKLELNYAHMEASIDYAFPSNRFVYAEKNYMADGINEALERYKSIHNDKAPTHAYLSAELFEEIENPEQYDVEWCPAPPLPEGEDPGPNANKIAFVDWVGEPLRVVEGPSADFDAPKDHTGKFGKGWRVQDPSSTSILLEWSFIPVWDKYQVVVLDLS